jgi:hypothetical protein
VVVIGAAGRRHRGLILLGETNIGRRRVARMREVLARLPDAAEVPGAKAANLQPEIPDRYAPLFRVGHSVNGFEPVGGNRARLLPDSNAAIESMIADIDGAKEHVHLTFLHLAAGQQRAQGWSRR